MSEPCPHLDFKANVNVGRLTNDSGAVTDFVADIKVECLHCKMPFVFKGLPVGVSMHQPMISLDGHELRAPIEPDDGTIKLPSRTPGFTMRMI